MQITSTLLRALSSLPPEEVTAQFNRALQLFMQDPNAIISASDGAGQSYTKTITATAQEILELWQRVKDMQAGISPDSDTQIYNNIIISPFNR